jgi:hypothetical protein
MYLKFLIDIPSSTSAISYLVARALISASLNTVWIASGFLRLGRKWLTRN